MMTKVSIYHNPKCSKSRQTLELLKSHNCDIQIIKYLKQPPSHSELQHIIEILNLQSPRELIRQKEAEYKSLHLDNENLSASELIEAMIANPKLIERPIVISGKRAVIGRPPENALEIIK